MFTRLALTTALILSVTACANVSFKPPGEYDVKRVQVHNVTYDEAWARAVDWFAGHNITIDKIEKTSGLITAKYDLATDENYLDCGQLQESGTIGKSRWERVGSLNITIREEAPSRSRVTVNFFGTSKFAGLDSWDARPVHASNSCVSTGRLEQSIHSAISR